MRQRNDFPPASSASAPRERQNSPASSASAPKGQRAPSPGQASEATRHPGLGKTGFDTPPEGAKATTEAFNPDDEIPPVIAFDPSGGASFALCANPGCRIASLACSGLGAYNPFGVFVERLKSANRAGLWASPPFGVFVERLHALFERLQSALRCPVVGEQGRPTLPCGRCWPSGWFSGKGA